MSKEENYDFSGIATAYNVLCGDGRVIMHGAFDHQDGEVVPVVWRHQQSDIRNFLGHALLKKNEGEPLGIRSFATFNKTTQGQQGKQLVDAKEIESLSIYANDIIEHEGKFEVAVGVGQVSYADRAVEKGTIREVSLVVKGMNPGAKIDDVVRHSDDPLNPNVYEEDGIIVHSGLPIDVDLEIFMEDFEEQKADDEESPADQGLEEVEDDVVEADKEGESEEGDDISHQEEETLADILETMDVYQRLVAEAILHSAGTGETLPTVVKPESGGEGRKSKDVWETMTEEQQETIYYLAGDIASQTDEETSDEKSDEESMSQGDTDMSKTYTPFENDNSNEKAIAHESVISTLQAAKTGRAHSLREMFSDNNIGDAEFAHSITDVDFLFPDARAVKPGGPMFWPDREMGWVNVVMKGVRPRPFSRIKSWYADISGADARAKGWTSPNQKVEEVIAVLKRTTVPQTIYKLQKLDRDDVLDITDFNVVVWLKQEMRLMLEEELARAILITDGRNDTGNDAIMKANVRAIYNDDDVYAHKSIYNDVGSEDDWANFTDTEVLAYIDHVAQSMTYYQGAGAPTFYCQPAFVSKALLVRDTTGRRIHDTVAALAAAMRVSRIVEVPVMAGLEDTGVVDPSGTDQNGAAIPVGTYDIATMGIIVNLSDYVIGADNGGETQFFDDFDLNFNKHEYLLETRVSGALVVPKAAVVCQLVTAKTA